MPFLLIKDLPRFECLLEASKRYPDLDPTACEVFLNLFHTGDQVFRHEIDYLKQFKLAQGRFAVLMLLKRQEVGCTDGVKPPTTPAELADAINVTRATMTGLVDTLEKDGYVVRKPDPNDRRTLRVALTDRGSAFLEELLPGYFRHISRSMRNLNEEERKTLVRLLGKIQSGIPAANEALAKELEVSVL